MSLATTISSLLLTHRYVPLQQRLAIDTSPEGPPLPSLSLSPLSGDGSTVKIVYKYRNIIRFQACYIWKHPIKKSPTPLLSMKRLRTSLFSCILENTSATCIPSHFYHISFLKVISPLEDAHVFPRTILV